MLNKLKPLCELGVLRPLDFQLDCQDERFFAGGQHAR